MPNFISKTFSFKILMCLNMKSYPATTVIVLSATLIWCQKEPMEEYVYIYEDCSQWFD